MVRFGEALRHRSPRFAVSLNNAGLQRLAFAMLRYRLSPRIDQDLRK
jgi:hypothetical protein